VLCEVSQSRMEMTLAFFVGKDERQGCLVNSPPHFVACNWNFCGGRLQSVS